MERSIADFTARLYQWYRHGPFMLPPTKLKFAEGLLQGLSRKEAMRVAKPNYSEKTLTREAHRNFHDPDVQVYLYQRFSELRAKEIAVKGLVADMENPHWKARSSARDQFFKLSGLYANQRKPNFPLIPNPSQGDQPNDYWSNRYMAEHGSYPTKEELETYKKQFDVEAESVAVSVFSEDKATPEPESPAPVPDTGEPQSG
jgi:hypothetical protein